MEGRLAEVAAKIDRSIKDAEADPGLDGARRGPIKAGSLLPPDKDNALDAIRSIQRLDKNNSYARGAVSILRNRC